MAEGVLSLLRESIVTNYNNYTERGCCPIHAKESLRHVYEAYHNLGGNDVATKLYHTLLEMPEEEPEEKEGIWKQQTSFTPYLLGKAILTSFPVYLVSTGGWEKFASDAISDTKDCKHFMPLLYAELRKQCFQECERHCENRLLLMGLFTLVLFQ